MAQRMRVINRFMRHVTYPESGCWEWTGTLVHGYAYFNADTQANVNVPAARWVYEYMITDVPKDKEVYRSCHNRRCVNPDHMEILSHSEIIRRSPTHQASIRRAQTHCKHGHSLSDALIERTGRRKCRTCHRIRDKNRPHRRKVASLTTAGE